MLAAQPALAPLRARAARRSARSPLLCSASALKTMEVTGRKVEVYSDAAAASAAVVDAFVAAYHECVPKKGSLTIAIPSGSVVKALGGLKGKAGIDFSKVHVWFTNERDGGKTFSGDKADFLEPCGVPLGNCHPITGLSDPVAAAKAYEAAMMASPVLAQANGGPCFDLIMLGTGDDGHCASLNPGSAEIKAPASAGYVLPIPASDKPGGATVSMRLINNAARVVVSAVQKIRAPMVKRALSGVFEEHGCPAGLVKAVSTVWLVDQESIAEYAQ